MTDENAGVPGSDPRHIDPAGGLADAVESGDLNLELDEAQDREELRAFLDAVNRGEYDPVDPSLEATVRIVRALLEDGEGGEG
jgi:ankyrin repeat protein